MIRFIALLLALGGCCLDEEAIEENIALGNTVSYEDGRICVDSRGRDIPSKAKICAPRCGSKWWHANPKAGSGPWHDNRRRDDGDV